MVNPLILLALALGFAFIFPLFEKIHIGVGKLATVIVFSAMAAIPALWLFNILTGEPGFVYMGTAGLPSFLTINVAVGIYEATILTVINSLGLFVISQLIFSKTDAWKGKQIILFAVLLLGANGLVITRDLFNIFVFMEISSISLFGLLSTAKDQRVFEGGFKYMLATGLSSVFYLIGIGLFYLLAGTLNLDAIPANVDLSAGPIGLLWPVFIITGLLIELKPALANGWAMDTYEAADHSMGAMMSGIQATAFLMVLTKMFALVNPALMLPMLLTVGGLTFIVSQIQALSQTSFKKMLGYSSSAQIGLVLIVLSLGSNAIFPAIILLLSHSVGKTGLFFVGKYFDEKNTGFNGSVVESGRNRPFLLILAAIFIVTLIGLPPFPAFGAKYSIIQYLANSDQYLLMFIILSGSLLEGVYLFRWFSKKIRHPEDKGTTLEEEVPADNVANKPVYKSTDVIGEAPQTVLAGIDGAKKVIVDKKAFTWTQLFLGLMAVSLFVVGYYYNIQVGLSAILFIPFVVVIAFGLLDLLRVPTKIQVILSIAATAYYGWILLPQLQGIKIVFGAIFIIGTLVQLIIFLNRKGRTPGLMAMIMGLIVSLGTILVSNSNFGLFFGWEMMTLTSYFLMSRGNKASAGGLRYIIFSLGSAFTLLAGLTLLGNVYIGDAFGAEGNFLAAKILISLGALIKMGNIGFHIWLPVTYAEAEDDVSSLFSTILSKAGLFLLFLGGSFFAENLIPAMGNFRGLDFIYIIGWIGAITAVAGSMMALFQEDIKYTLAYSSMGQVGYMVLGFAVMSHLGWMSSLYLAVTHTMIKGMLFIAIAGVVYRTGTRFMYQMGGLIKRMPLSFISVLVGIIALSGVPPLSGFGAKWLIYSALLEKGWYLQAALAMFASGVAFLYLFRLIHAIFLGQEKGIYREIKEAPIVFLIPQYIFFIIVMAFSMYPNLILKPLQEIITPYFASTIEWNGYEVITSMGYWNGNAVMYVVMGVFAVPLIWLLVMNTNITKVKQFNIVFASERPDKPETTHYAYNFFGHYQKALGFLVDPWARRFWDTSSNIVHTISGGLRRWNSGNPQGYMFQIVLYLIFIFVILGGQA
ncbi:MAG: proton-conducting transporter membrane subunit [Spirochaetaceae bacterium]